MKAVPNIPTTFVPRGSPHFVAALSGRGQEYPLRKTSVYKNALSTNQLKKHSTVCRPNLPIIQVTMEEKEGRDAWNVQRKLSSSFAPTRVELGSLEISERCNTASQANEKQRKTSVKERIVVGETPLGKDVLFRRKISNSATPKITKAEEKERLLMKYTPLNNETMNVGQYNKKQIKNLYFSRYNISMEVRKTAEVLPSLFYRKVKLGEQSSRIGLLEVERKASILILERLKQGRRPSEEIRQQMQILGTKRKV